MDSKYKKEKRTIKIDVKKTLNIEQIKLLLDKSKDTPINLQVMFAVLMGLRKQEIDVKSFSNHRELEIPYILFEAILEERKNMKRISEEE